MTEAPLDLVTLLRDVPKGAWVALASTGDKVLAYDFDVQDVLRRARELGETEPIITRVPEAINALVL